MLQQSSPNCQTPKCLWDLWALSSIITRLSHKETLESWWVKIHWSYIKMRCWERVGSKSSSPCLALCSWGGTHISGSALGSWTRVSVRYSLWKALLPPITPDTSWPRGMEHIPKPCFTFTLPHPELQGEPQWGYMAFCGSVCGSHLW